MTNLWIAAAALTILVLAALLLPMILRKRNENGPVRADFDLTVYKDQLAEIDRDVERGILSLDQATAARTEIERRMLVTAGEDGAGEIKNAPAPNWLMVLILVTVPVGAFSLYANMGQPAQKDQPYASRKLPNSDELEARKTQLANMINSVQARIKQDPENPQNWAILGQVRQMLGDNEGSVQAYEQLVKVTNRNPDALMVLAEAMFVEAKEVVTPAAVKLFKEAKKTAPQNPMSYYYLALERQMAQDFQGAMDEYANLLRISPSNEKWVANIQTRMKTIAANSGLDVPEVTMLPPLQKQVQVPASGPTAEQMKDAQNMSSEEQKALIRSMVDRLADKLKANPDDLAGWKRLANAYRVLGDEAKRTDAEAQIKRLKASAAVSGPTPEQIKAAQGMSQRDRDTMVLGMVNRLADKLKANPDDLAGWKRLANAYDVLGDTTKRAEAEAQIKRLEGL